MDRFISKQFDDFSSYDIYSFNNPSVAFDRFQSNRGYSIKHSLKDKIFGVFDRNKSLKYVGEDLVNGKTCTELAEKYPYSVCTVYKFRKNMIDLVTIYLLDHVH